MNYKYTLIVENEDEKKIFSGWCLTEEGVSEELLRKAGHAIAKYEDEGTEEFEDLDEEDKEAEEILNQEQKWGEERINEEE